MIQRWTILFVFVPFLTLGCGPSTRKADLKTTLLTADTLPQFYPRPGTKLLFNLEVREELNGSISLKTGTEEWSWRQAGSGLELTRKNSLGETRLEAYDLDSALCMSSVDKVKLSPCMPVLVDLHQENPLQGFTGLLEGSEARRFSAEHTYLGPELLTIKGESKICHKVQGKKTGTNPGDGVEIISEAWWAEGLGIVKLIETKTSKGLKRVTTLTQSPK